MHNPRQSNQAEIYSCITTGTVVANNDPQQTGRLRIMVPAYGDHPDMNIEDLPWARASVTSGGVYNNDTKKRGPSEDVTSGTIAYGFCPSIPGKGAIALVTCLNGDPMSRVWLGFMMPERLNHTLPSGRYLSKGGKTEGPMSSLETSYEPLKTNLQSMFGGFDNPEFVSRGMDIPFAKVDPKEYESPSSEPDKTLSLKLTNGKTVEIPVGYSTNNTFKDGVEDDIEPHFGYWASPGGHVIYMSDDPANCRIVLRSTSGTRVLIDDTNERIYLATAKGNSWFELDYDGTMDAFLSGSLNAHVTKDVNITSDQTIRLYGKQGVHIKSDTEIRIDAGTNIEVKAGAKMEIGTPTWSLAAATAQVYAPVTKITADTYHLKTAVTLHTGQISQNSTEPAAAENVTPQPAYLTNRLPQHEPWPRSPTKSNDSHDPKYANNDPNVGVGDGVRGKYWRR